MCDLEVMQFLSKKEQDSDESSCHCETESLPAEEKTPKEENNFSVFDSNENNKFRILHPDDPLMNRFQDALKNHLTRIDNKLSEEILEIKHNLKSIQKEREDEGLKTRSLELSILNQRKVIENYQNIFSDAIASREHFENQAKTFKKQHKSKLEELKAAQTKQFELTRQLEQLALKEKWYSNLENEISSQAKISKRISEKDSQVQRQLLQEKKQKDYFLFTLDNEIWKIESEKNHIQAQLKFSQKSKDAISQEISDTNAELEAVQTELKRFVKNWNYVLLNMKKRDEINIEQRNKCKEMHNFLKGLQSEIDNIKKDTTNEMVKGQLLTDMKMKNEADLLVIKKDIDSEKLKTEHLEVELNQFVKISEHCEKEYNEALLKLQRLQNEETELSKEIENTNKSKSDVEDRILAKLNETMMHDKAIRNLNKELIEIKKQTREHETLTAHAESTHNKNLLSIQKLMSSIEEKKFNLEEFEKLNKDKESQIQKIEFEIQACVTNIGVKEAKLLNLKKKIEEILYSTKGEEVNVQKLKLLALEKSIDEIEAKNQEACKFWMRQQGNLVDLREQRNAQLQELSMITKQMMIIEQKNFKLECELERQKKDQNKIDRQINDLQQSLINRNTRLAARKDFKQHLEDINHIITNENMLSLEEAERELMTLKTEIKELINAKETLNNNLYNVQMESLSWEKKVQMACEASKNFKEERKGDGDIATMKSEIHRMEMRLSHLKKFQQKLIQDMEFCISRRENILERVTAEEKKNPKCEHNRRIIIQKRLDDQKIKIQQMNKELRQVQNEVSELEESQKEFQTKIDDAQKNINEIEDNITDIDKRLAEAEIMKNHNLEIIIRKQKKAALLLKIKNGNYKSSHKSDLTLDEEMERQKKVNENLKEILSQTKLDFPQLKSEIRRILLSLDV